MGQGFEKAVAKKGGKLHIDEDLVGLVWEDRPELPCEPAYILDVKYAGKSVGEKLCQLREKMASEGAQAHALTTLDDIARTLNIRGNDLNAFPVVLSYLTVTENSCIWY